jgi:hypothetical protein
MPDVLTPDPVCTRPGPKREEADAVPVIASAAAMARRTTRFFMFMVDAPQQRKWAFQGASGGSEIEKYL